MTHLSGLSRRRVQQLLAEAKHDRSAATRIETFSRRFLGCPYKSSPLIGSPDEPEVFVASLHEFDCVTYIETVLALARAATVDGFIACLRRIRYENGRVEWKKRNHYMTGWIRNNLRNGTLRPIPAPGIPVVERQRLLDLISGLPARRATVACVPKHALPRLARALRTGDLIFFASTRGNLDFFHAGIIVRDGDRLRMRHASRSQGGVVEQELGDFLTANRMAGVTVVRPRETSPLRRDTALMKMVN